MFDLLGIGAIPEAWPALVLPLWALAVSTIPVMLALVLLLPVRPPRRRAPRVRRLEGTRAA